MFGRNLLLIYVDEINFFLVLMSANWIIGGIELEISKFTLTRVEICAILNDGAVEAI